jgi:hypothetical protein
VVGSNLVGGGDPCHDMIDMIYHMYLELEVN